MATCTLTLSGNTAALSDTIYFEAMPNQAIDDVFVDTTPVLAQASGTSYIASLIRKAKYRVIGTKFPIHNMVFTVPDSATADLGDLVFELRTAY